MKKLGIIWLLGITLLLSGCFAAAKEVKEEVDKQLNKGIGEVTLLTPEITPEDNTLRFKVTDFDEEKTTFVYVANQKVMEEKLKNDQEYTIDIEGLEDAHPTDYKPKVHFVQTENDSEAGEESTMFKEVRYTVE
ncbi:hypothetical protein JZO70_09095 [Enterococcus sp. 669A]|uniref:Lipoprotein n=1 Tax=Candidatus Enterococcus moelleringii TaxID=2815325 RepID=A0ABS3LB75_9ENTE|nr:hypothetical protein [Enterococcus sp. 669A]MBO1306315.1 hypothetical protein [Enterococcus sp. 669A]